MKAREVLQRRILLSRLLLALIAVPAVGIVGWLSVVKAPPGNAVLIEEGAPPGEVGGIGVRGTTQPTLSLSTSGPMLTPESATTLTPTQPEVASSPTVETITVFVSGAVKAPGVYTLPGGARVADAVEMAGGLRPDADLERINLAARIADEEHISVPEKGATAVVPVTAPPRPTPATKRGAQPTSRPRASEVPRNKVNVNTASSTELETLPGIGPALAARIIEYRTTNGPFRTVEELMRVPGIKEVALSRLRDLVTVGP